MTSTTEQKDTGKLPEMIERGARIIDPKAWNLWDQCKADGWPEETKAISLEAVQPSIDKAHHIMAATKSEPAHIGGLARFIIYSISTGISAWFAYKAFTGTLSRKDIIFIGILAAFAALDSARKILKPT
jgi:hypothetical protein